MAVSLYTVRIVLRTLTEVDYGIYSAVGGIVMTFSVVSNVLTNASQRFFSFELGKKTDVESGRVLFSTLFFTYLSLAFLVILLMETGGIWFIQNKMTIPEGRESAAMWVFQFALLSFVFSLLSNPFQAMIIAKERMGIYAYVSITDVVFKLLIVYCLTAFHFDQLKVYAVLVALVHLIINGIYVIFSIRIAPETRIIKSVDKNSLKAVFSYSSWTLFGAIAGMCNTQGVNIALNVFWGPIANAAYAISSQVSSAVTTFAGNFTLAIKPPTIKSYAEEDYPSVLKLFNFGTKITFLLMYMLILPIYVRTSEILSIWLGQVGDHMVDFVRLTLIYTLIVALSNPITNIIQAAAKVRIYHGIVDGFTLLCLPTTILLYKLGLEINCCYYVMIIIFLIAHCLRTIILKKVFPVFSVREYIWRSLFPMIVCASLSMGIMICINKYFSISLWGTLLCCSNALLLVVVLSLFILFSREERQFAYRRIKQKFHYHD